ncbi:hypothetical protein FC72_GL000019 [Companilactobacillus tucceti DSM 20183]|uniref:Uncharacterized protein n=1 Tax=Companilactobacillus tucceti DSM 20183 TaxID=1423811 RepID=A0A0R1JBX3_9LACO|nr:hypothetical protein [Companilactobacillus tucceti]KRK65578.1 hypothetical protein FC72_GL000019 [Companilactobacillus tucceti DSM 20183]
MEYLIAFTIVMVFMLIGDWVSAVTKAFIPSIFITAVLFAIGFWTIIPKDIVAKASFNTAFTGMGVSLLLVHLGTLMSLKELINQWKAVCIALLGVLGTLVLTLTVGTLIFDWHTVVAAIPPLTGGMVATLLMTDGLKAAGATALVALPVSMFILHSFIGYPMTAILLRKEGRRLKEEFKSGKGHIDPNAPKITGMADSLDTKKHILHLPEQFQSPVFIIVRVALIALLGNWLAGLMNGVINANVICLILGVLAHQLGLLEDNALTRAGVFNWLIYGLMAYVFSQLSLTTPDIIGGILIQILVLIALGILGMFIASYLLAKPFGMSKQMAFACSLTALFGFPADFILTTEVCHTIADNDQEEEYLTQNMLPKMLVGGFATVSMASVIIASVFLKLI